jgi:hypothetical protein
LRAPSWIRGKRLHVNDPPLVRARNVYDLRDCHKGQALIVAAPGPSFASFPREELLRHPSIGVNAALELFEPTYWLFAEPFFTREYRSLYAERRSAIVTTRWQALAALEPLLPAGKDLFWFRYGHAPRLDEGDRREPLNPKAGLSVLKATRPDDGRRPWWALPDVGFLPGRCSVATHAVSLAVLMGARAVVTIGIDFRYQSEEAYYTPGVAINPGPRRKQKALSCGKNWAILAARKGVWEGVDLVTISPAGGLPGARRVSVDEAVKILRT